MLLLGNGESLQWSTILEIVCPLWNHQVTDILGWPLKEIKQSIVKIYKYTAYVAWERSAVMSFWHRAMSYYIQNTSKSYKIT